jgi:N utilization substance protein B
VDGPDSAPADREFFRMLAQGVSDQMIAVDRVLADTLQNQTLERLDAILRAVLRVGAYELMSQKEIPARVIISEYLDLAHAFFSGSETKLVNGVLDKIAQDLRPDEFK